MESGNRTLGVVMDPIEQIKPYKDTSLAMLLEAQHRGWRLQYMQPGDLYVRDGEAYAHMRALRVSDDNEHWFDTGDVANIDPHGFMQITDRSKDVIKSGGDSEQPGRSPRHQ